MHLLAETAAGATQYGIAFGIATGIVGALVALYKLRGERDSAAVSQAQGAMETMEGLNDALEHALERANARADFYKGRYEETVAELESVRQRWGPFPADDHPAEPRP